MDESIYWEGWLRVDNQVCRTENTFKWRKGGFYHARLGIESGSGYILELMGKKITVDQIKTALFNLAQAGIKTSTLWIIGYPGETEADFQQTLDLIEESKDNIYEAEGTPFWYHINGQVNSNKWLVEKKHMLLYPEQAKPMLITQTWVLDCEPGRETIYNRLNRFIKHLHKLGIPNTYSLQEIDEADKRWIKLHKNAVPPFINFKNRGVYLKENKTVKKISFAQNTLNREIDFGF